MRPNPHRGFPVNQSAWYWLLSVLAFAVFAFAVSFEAYAVSLQCKLGSSRCIKSQETEIPSKQAIEVLDRCDEFTANDIGRIAMRMSHREVLDKSGDRLTPLVRAWHAYGDLIDSPLKFARTAKAEDAKYTEIKRACLQLARDFDDDSKWTK